MPRAHSPSPELTERQHFWLEHLKHALASGSTLTAYAAAHNLKRASLYGHLKMLRARGLLPASARRKARLARVVRAVDNTSSPGSSSLACVCRVHLPNGCVVEWQGEPGEEQLTGWLRSASALR